MDYKKSSHNKHCLCFHLVLVIKYRRKVINSKTFSELKRIFIHLSSKYNINLLDMNHDKDHVHISFDSSPNSNLPKFINSYKSYSSREVKKRTPTIKTMLWKEYFWSRGYLLTSTGGTSIDIIKKYIERQGDL